MRHALQMGLRPFAVMALVALALVPAASSKPQTTAPSIFVNVHVTLTDKGIILSPNHAPRGSDARFIVRNIGKKPHTFTVGSKQHGVGLQTGFSRVFKPKEHAILLLYLNYRGPIAWYSGVAADLAKPGFKGTFIVGAQCNLCVQDD